MRLKLISASQREPKGNFPFWGWGLKISEYYDETGKNDLGLELHRNWYGKGCISPLGNGDGR